ncbi:cell wall-binding repeat-containing protein [Labedaea rhizosphaerae]|uniref:Putative cell wall binding repeat protein n=1 Tax=Labedaea rhizosphaerae TaxID=598644 RepID=A0A4R6SL88_LABRH|nr:cell wall-binding repeat-containing protein [Labedaea rhizosphaerae]TDQ04859.1 putative cell wall binding repeat protein [Labedaea rhizosphaerae]
MHTRGLRALSIAAATATVLSGILVGGLGAAAEAAPGQGLTKTEHLASAQVARDHGAQGAQRHAAHAATTRAAADDASCMGVYPNADNSMNAVRYAGTDRYKTAVCVSQGTWFDATDTNPDDQDWVADAVVLARGDMFPDALAGGPLAAQVEGPLLLTKSTTLLPEVQAEIQRVLAPGGKVYLLGSTGSLSDGVKNAIVSLGYTPVRLGGSDRFQTAIAIAKAMPATNQFFVTTGMNFPDALAAGNAAAMFTVGAKYGGDDTALPVALLFTNDAKMPAATSNFIVQRAGQFNDYIGLYTAGRSGDQAVVATFGADLPVARYVGKDRYNTAFLINQDNFTVPSTGKLFSNSVGLANGLNFPDALAGTVLLAEIGAPLVLTPATTLNSASATFLHNHAGDTASPYFVQTFGSSAVVSDSVMLAARDAFTPTA